MFDGVVTALVTPFRGGALDLEAMGRLLELQLEGGVEGVVVSGSSTRAAISPG